jgi:hypothetical protein
MKKSLAEKSLTEYRELEILSRMIGEDEATITCDNQTCEKRGEYDWCYNQGYKFCELYEIKKE